MEVVTRDSPKPAVRGEIPVAVRGFPRAAVYRRSSPPFAAHPGPPFMGDHAGVHGSPRPAIQGRSHRRSRLTQTRPFAGNGSAARGEDGSASRGDDDAAARDDEGSVARGDDDAADHGDDDAAARGKDGSATRGFPRPSKGRGTRAFGGPG